LGIVFFPLSGFLLNLFRVAGCALRGENQTNHKPQITTFSIPIIRKSPDLRNVFRDEKNDLVHRFSIKEMRILGIGMNKKN